jgi:hypothetical protein
MPRRRLLLAVSSLVAVALAAAGCTIPTTKDGGGYGPSNQSARKAAKPAPVELHSGTAQKLKSVDASWTPAVYQAASGTKIVLNVSNADPTQHNFTFGDLEISKNLPLTRAPRSASRHPNRVATGSIAIPPAGDAGLADGHLAVAPATPPASPHLDDS